MDIMQQELDEQDPFAYIRGISYEDIPKKVYKEAEPFGEVQLPSGEIVKSYGEPRLGSTLLETSIGASLSAEKIYNYNRERIVFDWDDTIKDTGKYWVQAHREVLVDFGFTEDEVSDDKILALFGNIHVGDALGIDRFDKDNKQYTDDEVWGLIKGRATEILAEHPIDPLLIEALNILSAQPGSELGVWSSSPRELLEESILIARERQGLTANFSAVVSVDDVDPDKHKPHVQGFLMVVYAMDVKGGYLHHGEVYSEEKPLDANGVWMVGDSPNDILAGKAVGASTIWLENPLQGHNAFEKRKKVLRRLRDGVDSMTLSELMKNDLRPTIVARTFDAEQAGMGRRTPLNQLDPAVVRGLDTENYTFVKLLLDKNRRALMYHKEQVRKSLITQGINMDREMKILLHIPDYADSAEEDEALVYGPKVTPNTAALSKRQFGPKPDSVAATLASVVDGTEGTLF